MTLETLYKSLSISWTCQTPSNTYLILHGMWLMTFEADMYEIAAEIEFLQEIIEIKKGI